MKLIEKKTKDNKTFYNFCKIPIFQIRELSFCFKFHVFFIQILTISKDNLRKIFSNKFTKKYVRQFFENNYKKSPEFVDITNKPYVRKEDDVKAIAFYLPQFYSFPTNDKSFGRGFTEWTNVTKAIPHFIGHRQPQLPIDVGFYNLEHDDVMYRQIELAKMYGIYGFCFYYYWFSGEKIMEKPIYNWLNNKELDFPFCIIWTNHNWSKQWDGGNRELIIEQKHYDEDDEKLFYDLLPFFKDKRYIKIGNKPVFSIFNPSFFTKERFLKFKNTMQKLAKENGLEDICFFGANHFSFDKQEEYGIDALCEFLPNGMFPYLKTRFKLRCNNKFKCSVFDMKDYIENKKYFLHKYNSPNVIKSIFPSWDNTARKAYSEGGAVFYGETPELYKKWLIDILKWTKENKSKDNQFVFINAWNEWSEGAHLEPDNYYGYAYLQATKEAMEEYKETETE